MNKREKVLLDLQEDVLRSGIYVQDWTTFQLENAFISYCAGATLSCVIMCQTAIESYIRNDEQLTDRSFYKFLITALSIKKLRRNCINLENIGISGFILTSKSMNLLLIIKSLMIWCSFLIVWL